MSEPKLPDFDALWDYGNPAATEVKFQELLASPGTSRDRSYHAQLLTQIARTQGLQGKFDAAHATLDEAESLCDDMALPRVRCLLERGRVFNSSKRPEEGRPLFERAYEMAVRESLDAFAVDAAHMIAIVEKTPEAQLEWNLRAMELAERSSDVQAQKWRASLYNNIGWTYFESGEYGKAIDVFSRAVDLRQKQNQPRELRIARYCVAKTLRMQGKLDDALPINRQIVQEAAQAGEPDGYFHEELAECLLALGDASGARQHFRAAHEQLSRDKWFVENEPDRLARIKAQAGMD
jgi:tetratricopeptide (TPR) repeat protein